MQREPRRWRTSFGRWVRAYGAARIASGMQRTGHPVTHWAVYHWMAGSHSPRAEHIAALVRLSRGTISVGDVYRHQEVVRRSLIRQPKER